MENRTLAKQAYEHIRQQILSNELRPGERLRESELAGNLRISRAPLREALKTLAAEGMVTINPRRGSRVATLDPLEFLELVQVREALEGMGVQLATLKVDGKDLNSLYAISEAMRIEGKKNNIEEFFSLNDKFHSLFMEIAGNNFLKNMYSQSMDHLKRYRLKTVILRRGMDHSVEEHETILAAVKKRDPEKASRLMTEHIRVPLEVIEQSQDAWSQDELEMVGKSNDKG